MHTRQATNMIPKEILQQTLNNFRSNLNAAYICHVSNTFARYWIDEKINRWLGAKAKEFLATYPALPFELGADSVLFMHASGLPTDHNLPQRRAVRIQFLEYLLNHEPTIPQ